MFRSNEEILLLFGQFAQFRLYSAIYLSNIIIMFFFLVYFFNKKKNILDMMCETKQIKKIEKRFVCLQTHLDNDKCIMGHIIQTSQLVISPPPPIHSLI